MPRKKEVITTTVDKGLRGLAREHNLVLSRALERGIKELLREKRKKGLLYRIKSWLIR